MSNSGTNSKQSSPSNQNDHLAKVSHPRHHPKPEAETLLLQTILRGEKRSQIWSGTTPIAIGYPFRWILERTPKGVRVRDILRGILYPIDNDAISHGATVELKDPMERRSRSHPVIHLKKAAVIPPIYLTGATSETVAQEKSMPLLFAYGGMRRSLINCTLVHSAYVAYASGKPVFALYLHKQGFKVKTLADGVRLKLKGEKPIVGEAGTEWEVSHHDLHRVTLFRAWHWWRFAIVSSTAQTAAKPTITDDDETAHFWTMCKWAAVFAILASIGVLWFGPKTPDELDEDSAPIVRLETKKGKIFLKTKTNATVQSVPGDNTVLPSASAQASKPEESAPPPTVMSSLKALAQAKSLKQALAGLKPLGLKGIISPKGTVKAGSKNSGLFDGPTSGPNGGTAMSNEVKPTLSGTQVEVHGIGGNGTGGTGLGKGQSGGYSSGGVSGSKGGKGGSFVSLGDGGYKADEGLTKDEVGSVIYGHMGEVRYCHDSAMLQNPKVEGKLVLRFSIDPRGRVETATSEYSTLPPGPLEECVRTHLLTWTFPKPRGGAHVTVSYPFNFKVLERE